ncbi:expressed unknown protein [Seminavis robusta]|uniref:Uncharacterized protein n=1 Tax=Seminavis robusta TaxID=568900 RepID=A0A9N8DBQ8_9STRA|nr:expressed unknown protein [Seminavis robusta]|eukprot:Sro9_g007700.1 n/a (568) ;mRNA; r:222071-223774
METITSSTRPISEARARYKLSWHVNELFLSSDCVIGQCSDCSDVAAIVDLCKIHPNLATELLEVEDTGEKITPLEAFIRIRVPMSTIQLFCELFPMALQTKNAQRNLPLHVACEELLYHQYGVRLICHLASRFPDAVRAFGSHGSLPLHKLLSRYRLTASSVPGHAPSEVMQLVELFPESTTIIGPELGGIDPLHFVLSNSFHPTVAECILSNVPKAVTHFSFGGSLAGGADCHAVPYAKALVKFLPQLEHLVFKPKGADADGVHHASEAWSIIMSSLASCRNLKHLELQFPSKLFTKMNVKAYDTFAEILPQLFSVQVMILSNSPAKSRDSGQLHEALDIGIPITQLITSSGTNLTDLVLKEGIISSAEPILRVARKQVSRLKRLEIICSSCSTDQCDVTESLAALIQSNGSLQSLYLKNVQFQKSPVFQALMHNTKLKSMSLPGLIDAASVPPAGGGLSRVLQHYNTTLEHIECLSSGDFCPIDAAAKKNEEYQRIQFYLALNRLGRGRTRTVRSSCQDLLAILDKVIADEIGSPDKRIGKASIFYGILQDIPSQWATCRSSKTA